MKTIKLIFIIFLTFISILGTIFIFEFILSFSNQNKDLTGYDLKESAASQYLDHVSGNFHIVGPKHHQGAINTEWKSYPEGFDYQINKFGFFTDWPIDIYPKKALNEYRVVLIGGSGAQGWGAQNNEKMLYKQLEKKLNQKNNEKFKIHVINLAMASSNAIWMREELNTYGRNLEADMILGYLGINDVSGLLEGRVIHHDRPVGFVNNRFYSGAIGFLVRYFPIIFLKYGAAEKLEILFNVNHEKVRSLGNFNRHMYSNLNTQNPNLFFKNVILPETVKAFKGIKRENCGIPVTVVRQVWHNPDWTRRFLKNVRMLEEIEDSGVKKNAYDYYWDYLKSNTHNYLNDKWYFFDAQTEIWNIIKKTSSINIDADTWGPNVDENQQFNFSWLDNKIYSGDMKSFAVHLDNLGHEIVADWISLKVLPIIQNDYKKSRVSHCE